MPTALILGGSGKVARHLTRLLISKDYTVHSLIRSPSQTSSLTSLGAHPILQSLETSSVAQLAATIRASAADIVIWCAGAGGGDAARTRAVDHEAAVRSMDAAAEAGVGRYIMVSAVDVRRREGRGVPEWYDDSDRERSDGVWSAIGPYMAAKLAADTELREGNGGRGLRYTIVRPGRLVDGEGTGRIRAGKVRIEGAVSREDVAGTILACLEDEGTVGLAFDVLGGDVPIREAVGRVVEGRVDTFEGYY